ncbi:MAG: hypothetical protein HKN48_01635 [Flavobacteriaceae bacterium]|nr:hypothetical protein [Flavobacteriaceae bacterium]
MSKTQRNYKASKIKMFFFFLLLALIFWFLTKFSNKSAATVDVYLAYTNVPEAVMVSQNNLNEVSFNISATGFQFLSYKLKEPTIYLDISEKYTKGDSAIVYSSVELIKVISDQLDNNALIQNISPSELKVELDLLSSKKVPVTLDADISFRDGYRLLKPLVVVPDSIRVTGPSKALNELNSVTTKLLAKKNVAEDIDERITINQPSNVEINLSANQVEIKGEVEEFTQKKLTIPIDIINLPEEVNIKLIPKEVIITFEVAMSNFNTVSTSNFRIVCDYSLSSEMENYMVPKLVAQPEGVHHIEFEPKRVEYLIFK